MPKWKHVLTDEEYDGKERRGPHIQKREVKKVKLKKDRGLGRMEDRITPLSVRQMHKYKGHDTANSRSVCEKCGDPIRFATLDGRLVAVDLMCGKPHRHQAHRVNTPEMNRKMIEEMRKHDNPTGERK